MRAKPIILFPFLFLALVFASGQKQPAGYLRLLEEYVSADSIYQRGLKLVKEENYSEEEEARLNRQALERFYSLSPKLTAYDSLRFHVLVKTGELEHYFERHSKSLRQYEEAIKLRARGRMPDSLFFRPYLYSGLLQHTLGQFDSASAHLKKAEAIQASVPHKLSESERLYNNLGVLYFESGNYLQASAYFKKAAEVLPESHPYYRNLWVNFRINYATSLYKMEQYQEADRIFKGLLSYGIYTNEINNNIGLVNLYLGAPKTAISWFRKVHYSNRFITGLYNDMANAWINLKQYDSAYRYLHLADSTNQVFYQGLANVNHGLTLRYRGDIARESGYPQAALKFYQQAIMQFYPAYSKTDIKLNPASFTGLFSYINLFHTLTAKAEVYLDLFDEQQQQALGDLALDAYKSAFLLTAYVERTYESDEARLFLNKIKYVVHHKPIALSVDLYKLTKKEDYLEAAYEFDQMNKASVLSLNLQQNRLLTEKPGDQERILKNRITRLSVQALQVTEPAELDRINRAILDAEIELRRLERGHKTSSGAEIPSTQKIRSSLLDAKTLLLSYHLYDSGIIVFKFDKNHFEVEHKKFYPQFSDDLQSFISSIYRYSEQDEESVSRLSAFLLGESIKPPVNRLVIIPDEELNYLPFEALKLNGSYVFQKLPVQYQYSTSILRSGNAVVRNAPAVAFAPFSKSGFTSLNPPLARLPASGTEAQSTNGKLYLDENATKQTFLKSVESASIIHLATHAVVDESGSYPSYISFYPKSSDPSSYLLYEQEIYQLSLTNTELVVLSACETGTGELVKGEGIMSLSRAFSYAGCPNVITSLWKADDLSTSYIMKAFYSHLKRGATIDVALQRAKIDYLRDPSVNPRMKHPSYFAHLVFIGDLQEPVNNMNTLWFILLVLGAIAIWLIIKKRAARRRNF